MKCYRAPSVRRSCYLVMLFQLCTFININAHILSRGKMHVILWGCNQSNLKATETLKFDSTIFKILVAGEQQFYRSFRELKRNPFFKKRFYLFIFRKRGGEGKRGRETSMCGCLLHAPSWGPGRQPRHVPWLGIKPVTLWFAGRPSVHWATAARAGEKSF